MRVYILEHYLSVITVVDALSTFISHFSVPSAITWLDHGTEFKSQVSQVFNDFCKLHKINFHLRTIRNSNSNRKSSRVHSSHLENINPEVKKSKINLLNK